MHNAVWIRLKCVTDSELYYWKAVKQQYEIRTANYVQVIIDY